MNLAIVWFVLLFCGITWAQDDGNAIDTQPQPVQYDLLSEVLALREELGAVKTRLTDSETEILELRNKATTQQVIFSAAIGGGDSHVGPFNNDQTLIFRRVLTNIGGAYNQYSGIFVAPVAGVYHFSFFYHAGGANIAWVSLFKNNQLIAVTSDHKSHYDGADNGGNAVFIQLQRGDHVYVSLHAHTWVWGSPHHTTFSGFLVAQM